MKKLLAILFSFFVSATVIWNSSPSTDVAGYRLYSSTTSGEYTFGEGNEIMSADATETSKTITNIADDGRYYVMRAFDHSGNESISSSEVFFDPPPEGVGQLTMVSSQ